MLKKLDSTNRKIISLLSENPEMSQIELSHHLGLSQPAVSARIRELRKNGVIEPILGMNIKKAGLHLAKIDLASSNTEKILGFFDICPLYLTGLVTSGRHNLCLFLVGENISSIEAFVDRNLRTKPYVTDMEFNVVITPTKDFILPVKVNTEKKEKAPCGEICKDCSHYKSGRCLGCPSTIYYRGTIL